MTKEDDARAAWEKVRIAAAKKTREKVRIAVAAEVKTREKVEEMWKAWEESLDRLISELTSLNETMPLVEGSRLHDVLKELRGVVARVRAVDAVDKGPTLQAAVKDVISRHATDKEFLTLFLSSVLSHVLARSEKKPCDPPKFVLMAWGLEEGET